MSYILDALRKAERERRATPVPTLDATHGGPGPARHRTWPWALAVAMSAVAIWGLWGLWAPGPPDPVREALAPHAPVAGPASPARGPSTPSGAAGGPVELSSARVEPGPGQAAGASTGRPPVALEPSGPTARVAPVPTPAKAPDAPRAADDARDESAEGAETRTPAAGRPRPPLSGAPGGSGTGERRSAGAPSPAPTTAGPAVPAVPVVPPIAALAPAPSPEIGPGRVPPAWPADPLARLSLDVLVYSDLPAERLVFINGRKYVEGQAVNGDTVVEQITPEGAILRRQDQRIVLRPKLNPYARPGSP